MGRRLSVMVFRNLEGENKGCCRIGSVLSSPGDAVEYQLLKVTVVPGGKFKLSFLELFIATTFAQLATKCLEYEFRPEKNTFGSTCEICHEFGRPFSSAADAKLRADVVFAIGIRQTVTDVGPHVFIRHLVQM